MLRDGQDIGDLRSWRDGSTRYMAFVERVICANGGPYDDVRGAVLRPGATAWSHDAPMLPSDFYGARLDNVSASFRDREGKAIELDGTLISTVFQECHLCLHVYGTRILTRAGNVYRPQPWSYTPGPYTTLVHVVGTLEQFPGGSACLHSIAPYAQTALIAQRLCSLHTFWNIPFVEKYTGDPSAPNPAIAYTFTVLPSENRGVDGPAKVNIGVRYQHKVWLIGSVNPTS